MEKNINPGIILFWEVSKNSKKYFIDTKINSRILNLIILFNLFFIF